LSSNEARIRNEFRLRQATADDIAKLTALIAASVRGLSNGLYTPDEAEAALVHVFGVDSQLIADGTYYVIPNDDGTRLVAAGGWSARETLYGGDQVVGRADLLLDPATMPARIRAFFVHPDWTRRGLARMIFQECETAANARGFRAFELVATLPGVPLYRALGFTATEPVPIPMPGNLILSCLRMHRSIDDSTPTTQNQLI
jgi:GNAT superfamily N-acetyltransferase